jgi:hypothetical protein
MYRDWDRRDGALARHKCWATTALGKPFKYINIYLINTLKI